MLTLNRKVGESILIGTDVKVIVTRVTELPNGQFDVQLGCDAPRHISIDREEVRVKRERTINKVFNGNR